MNIFFIKKYINLPIQSNTVSSQKTMTGTTPLSCDLTLYDYCPRKPEKWRRGNKKFRKGTKGLPNIRRERHGDSVMAKHVRKTYIYKEKLNKMLDTEFALLS